LILSVSNILSMSIRRILCWISNNSWEPRSILNRIT